MKQFFYMMLSLFFFANAYAKEGSETKATRSIINDPVLVSGSMMQQFVISGIVTDSNGSPMIGVNVVVDGTTIGVVTDVNGKYTINVPNQQAVLQFSFIGYLTEKLSVGGQKTIDVKLIEDITNLQEVVVTGLGIKREQKALGYSVSSISAKDIVLAGTSSFGAALYGKASGVRIQSAPGGSTSAVSINIRGYNSVTGKNRPLFVVDGVPIRNEEANDYYNWGGARIEGNGLLDIQPEDIDNLSILKGASASALYGADGANGVVLITTKSGKGVQKKGLGVEFNMNYSIDKLAGEPNWQNEYGPGYGQYYFMDVGGYADGFMVDPTYRTKKFQGKDVTVGDKIIDPRTGKVAKRAWNSAYANFGPKMTGQPVIWWDGEFRNLDPQPNNYRDLFRTGTNASYNLAVSSGTEKFSYRLSYTRNESTPIQEGGLQNKNTFSLNTSVKISDRISTDVVVNYYDNYVKNRPIMADGLAGYQYNRSEKADVVKARYKNSNGYQYSTDPNRDPDEYTYFTPSSGGYMSGILWRQRENSYEENTDRILASATVNILATDWLKFKVQAGTDLTSFLIEEKDKVTVPVYVENTGYYGLTEKRYVINYAQTMAIFNKKLNDFDFTLTAGMTGREETGYENSAKTNGGLIQENWFSLSNSKDKREAEANRNNTYEYAYFGIMNLAYKNFAFIEGTLRDEYTSYLPPSDNHFMYPSLNTSLLLNEAFSFPRFINYSKIRLSWGMVGNRPLRYQANNSYTQGAVNGIPYSDFKTEYGNDKIKSEKKTEYEFGFENRLFDSRLVLDLTAYYNKTENLIMALAVPASSGSNSMLDNVGTISNRGLEIAATITPVRSKIFNWDIRLNGGLNRNKVEKLIQDVDYLELNWEGAGSVKIVAQEGKPYGEILTYSHKFDSNGNKVIDGDGYWVRDDSKYVSVGNSTPKFVGGISNNINFRNFFVNFLIDYRIGGKILSMTNYYGLNAGKLESSLAFRDKEHGGSAYYVDNGGKKVAWDGTSPIPADNQYAGKFNSDGSTFDGVFNDGMVLEGVDSNGKKNDKIISSADYYQNMFYWKSGFHEYGMFDNSYVKFREITIGYNIPANLTKKIGLQALNVSLIGRNLFYIYKNVPNIDPESMVGTSPAKQAIEYGFVPSSRSFGFALRASF